jgi:hypothetical protein
MYYNLGTIMPLFSLTDITFSGSSRNRDTTTSQLSGTAYKYNILRYPSDLGNYDQGHYILLHINEQKMTQVGTYESGEKTSSEAINEARRQYVGSTITGEVVNTLYTGAQDAGTVISQYTSEVSGKVQSFVDSIPGVDAIKEKLGSFTSGNSYDSGFFSSISGAINGISSLGQQALSGQGLRTTRRTVDTVALYMPDTLAFNDSQGYSDLNMGGTLASGAMSAIAGGIETYRAGGDANAIGRNLSPFLYDALTGNSLVKGVIGENMSAFLFSATGLAKNPMMEVLYTSPQLRTFRFDFMFYPRSEAEAKEVYDIIERIRFHQAPEYLKNSGGFYLIPPSEFDIKFMYNGQENPNIPKILGSCVLQSVDLDYAPNGFAAYESVGQNSPTKGGTGTPVATRLSLTFKETTIVTKHDFETGQNRAASIGGE